MAWRDAAGEIHVGLAHGQPDGYEQASGLLLPHEEADHGLFEIAGVLMHRASDGAYEVAEDQGSSGQGIPASDLIEPGEIREWVI